MAITVTSATLSSDGTLTIAGTEFTKTTTYVAVDDTTTSFEWVSAEEIVVSGVSADAESVTVEKGDVSETVEITAAEEEPAVPETTVAGEPDAPTVEPGAITAGTWPNPIDTFRTTVAGVALVGLIPVGDEKTPYPTGTQLGSGKKFWLQNGYYKSATPT